MTSKGVDATSVIEDLCKKEANLATSLRSMAEPFDITNPEFSKRYTKASNLWSTICTKTTKGYEGLSEESIANWMTYIANGWGTTNSIMPFPPSTLSTSISKLPLSITAPSTITTSTSGTPPSTPPGSSPSSPPSTPTAATADTSAPTDSAAPSTPTDSAAATTPTAAADTLSDGLPATLPTSEDEESVDPLRDEATKESKRISEKNFSEQQGGKREKEGTRKKSSRKNRSTKKKDKK
jgi:hypothetical protein